MILRDRDMTNGAGGWSGAGDGVLGERYFHLQNWRADVVGMVNAATGVPVERVSYSAYGVPRRIALAEYNDDGVLDAFDSDDFTSDFAANQTQNPPPYDRRLDVNADGVVDAFDYDDFIDDYFASQGDTGRGVLSRDDVGNRKGYAGYEFENALAGAMEEGDPSDPNALYHVRHRVYDAQRGAWTRRDPLGYVDGMSLYEYGRGSPFVGADPEGTRWEPCPSGGCGEPPPKPEPPLTDDECCKKALDEGLDEGLGIDGKIHSAGGRTICCQGRKVACSFYGLKNSPINDARKEALKGLDECVRSHERLHADSHTAPCPPGTGVDLAPWDPSITTPEQKRAAECDAYKAQVSCLQARIPQACEDAYLKPHGIKPQWTWRPNAPRPKRGKPTDWPADRAIPTDAERKAMAHYATCINEYNDFLEKAKNKVQEYCDNKKDKK